MGRISLEHLATAVRTVRSMSLQQKEKLADEVFAHQPNLLASVIAQQRLGVPYEKMDFLLEILLICYQAMKETGLRWALISEDDQEYQLTREVAILQYFEKSDARSQSRIAAQHLDRFPERELLAFVANEFRGWLIRLERDRKNEETDQYVLLAATNLVNCIAHALTSPG